MCKSADCSAVVVFAREVSREVVVGVVLPRVLLIKNVGRNSEVDKNGRS